MAAKFKDMKWGVWQIVSLVAFSHALVIGGLGHASQKKIENLPVLTENYKTVAKCCAGHL